MSMPQDLVLIRHGQSEHNLRVKASKRGDNSLYTDDLVTVPDRSWRLTDRGAKQAAASGAFLQENFPQGFDRHIVSPFIRTRETAACLELKDAVWEENRIARERSWGEIDGITYDEFQSRYHQNFLYKSKDPIYWSPPAGESLAEVSENRSSNLLRELSRNSSGARVLIVSHGEFILATRMLIEQWSDEEFLRMDSDPRETIRNCTMVQYSRRDPESGALAERLQWVRLASPVYNAEQDSYEVQQGDWRRFQGKQGLTGEDLRALVEAQDRRFTIDGLLI